MTLTYHSSLHYFLCYYRLTLLLRRVIKSLVSWIDYQERRLYRLRLKLSSIAIILFACLEDGRKTRDQHVVGRSMNEDVIDYLANSW